MSRNAIYCTYIFLVSAIAPCITVTLAGEGQSYVAHEATTVGERATENGNKREAFKFSFNAIGGIAAIGGIVSMILGYNLFRKGHTEHRGRLTAKSQAGELTFSGTGPGLFFMAFGALILMVALIMSS